MRKYAKKLAMMMVAFVAVVALAGTNVSTAEAAAKKPTKITMSTKTVKVDIKGQVRVTVKAVKPANATKAVKFKSSNKKVATVNSSGVIVGKKKGKATITVTSKKNKKAKAKIKVYVSDMKASGVKMSASKKAVGLKETNASLSASVVAPVGFYNQGITWSSSDPSVVTVANGKLTPVKAGTANVIARENSAGKTAVCAVTVYDYNMLSADDLKADLDSATPNYVVLDVRAVEDYKTHIKGAISADVDGAVTGNNPKAATDNIVKAVKKVNDPNAKYALVCYSGSRYAQAATHILANNGVDPANIFTLQGGFGGRNGAAPNATWADTPYCYKEVTVADGKVTFKATANAKFVNANKPAVAHFITSSLGTESQANNALFDTNVKPMWLHAALTEIGAIPWSTTNRTFKDGEKIVDLQGDNANYSKLKVEIYDGESYIGEIKDIVDYKKDGGARTADVQMVFSGNKVNQEAWNTGCVACLFSCYAGVTSNENIGIATTNAKQNYFYANDKLVANKEYTFVYSIADPAPTTTPVTADDLLADLKKAVPEYKVLDVRKKADYKTSHVVGSVSASVDQDVTGYTQAEGYAVENLSAAIAGDDADTNYVIVCYSGSRYAKATTKLLIEHFGIDPEKIHTLTGGFKNWTSNAYPYTAENGQNYVTADVLKADLASGTPAYTVLDVRALADAKAKHISGAYAADVDGIVKKKNSPASTTPEMAKENVQKAVAAVNDANAKYVLACYSGQSYATAATAVLKEMGINPNNIYTLQGGMSGWSGDTSTDEATLIVPSSLSETEVAETEEIVSEAEVIDEAEMEEVLVEE